MAKILLVEDNEMNRDMLSRRLVRSGFEVVMAVNGQEGIEMASSEKPDLILMDMSLPVMDGWTATRTLKADPETANIPVIALTGLTFAALALPMVALAKSYDFFLYYFTLFITPMSFLSGAFFPLTQLPAPLVAFAQALPLTHAVALLRPLAAGSSPAFTTLAVAVVLMGLLTVLPTRWALRRLTRRLLP